MTGEIVKAAKQRLRLSLKERLKCLGPESLHAQSMLATDSLINLPEFQSAKTVALFMNMSHSEIRTIDMIRNAFQMKKTVYLPKCNFGPKVGRKKNYLSMHKVSNMNQVLHLKPQGKYGILEPEGGDDVIDEGNLDLVVVPGIAFTKDKKRLGHGAGFYDEFINMYNEIHKNKPFLVGVGLQEQLIQHIPMEEHDRLLDCVIISGHESYY
ncbi:Piso0_000281 [Millerozyma farinosa CBS 7064]|uniref:5-formyltetrahydrofolate cyclo-ligase n=1 Tax=Pichia sorbitophila (strain ATCC MYA-4447 / BCRC 22081 / CBS 7064 / NBRC 10061 / NRRL Y-12695) TaxID=559304 RepID=G8YTK0_PICSO|nr:Piso0_000281 [Millerozyma farinosa CBS 7064]